MRLCFTIGSVIPRHPKWHLEGEWRSVPVNNDVRVWSWETRAEEGWSTLALCVSVPICACGLNSWLCPKEKLAWKGHVMISRLSLGGSALLISHPGLGLTSLPLRQSGLSDQINARGFEGGGGGLVTVREGGVEEWKR